MEIIYKAIVVMATIIGDAAGPVADR